jgi:hypothetical protein
MDNIIDGVLEVKMPVKEFCTDRNDKDRIDFHCTELDQLYCDEESALLV